MFKYSFVCRHLCQWFLRHTLRKFLLNTHTFDSSDVLAEFFPFCKSCIWCLRGQTIFSSHCLLANSCLTRSLLVAMSLLLMILADLARRRASKFGLMKNRWYQKKKLAFVSVCKAVLPAALSLPVGLQLSSYKAVFLQLPGKLHD